MFKQRSKTSHCVSVKSRKDFFIEIHQDQDEKHQVSKATFPKCAGVRRSCRSGGTRQEASIFCGGARALACESGARGSNSSLTQTCYATLGGYLTSLSLSSLRCCKTGDNSDIGGPLQCQVPAADPRPAPVERGRVSRAGIRAPERAPPP